MNADNAESAEWFSDIRVRLEELLDEYRAVLQSCLEGLTEQEARLRLVDSNTTLLGLVKHVTFVEGVWFDQAISGRSYAEIGIASTPARSFVLDDTDTIDELAFGAAVDGRGARPVWALHVQVLRELAQHAGHADIIREQVLARRSA
jgi:hypothetical protein